MSLKVLIVDDAKFMRTMLKDIFTKSGYEVVGEAETAEDCLESYKRLKPDLVTMDIIMPDKPGTEAIKEIIDYDKDAKIIVCSALGQQAMVLDALNAGAKDFIEKPFNPTRVIHSANKVLGQ